jgi:hypothetical protein
MEDLNELWMHITMHRSYMSNLENAGKHNLCISNTQEISRQGRLTPRAASPGASALRASPAGRPISDSQSVRIGPFGSDSEQKRPPVRPLSVWVGRCTQRHDPFSGQGWFGPAFSSGWLPVCPYWLSFWLVWQGQYIYKLEDRLKHTNK